MNEHFPDHFPWFCDIPVIKVKKERHYREREAFDINKPRWYQHTLPLTQWVTREERHRCVEFPDRDTAKEYVGAHRAAPRVAGVVPVGQGAPLLAATLATGRRKDVSASGSYCSGLDIEL
jgi:hypothetical protein